MDWRNHGNCAAVSRRIRFSLISWTWNFQLFCCYGWVIALCVHHSHAIGYYFQRSLGEIFDFIKWAAIGTAAAVWAYFATKARNKNKKVLYYLMIAPLFAVILLELVSFSIGMYHYLVQEYNIAHGIMKPDDSFYACQIENFLTFLISLCMSVYCYFFRKRFANERSCKESGGANPDPDAEESR